MKIKIFKRNNDFGRSNEVTLIWEPGHQDIKCNEEADEIITLVEERLVLNVHWF